MRGDDQIELSTRLCGSLIVNENFFLVLPRLNGVLKQARHGRSFKQDNFLKGSPQPVTKKQSSVSFNLLVRLNEIIGIPPKLYL